MRISYWSSDVCSSDLWCNCAPIQRLRGTCHSSSTSKNISISRWRALGVYGSHLTTRRPPRRVMPHPRNGRWRRRPHVYSRWSNGLWKRPCARSAERRVGEEVCQYEEIQVVAVELKRNNDLDGRRQPVSTK